MEPSLHQESGLSLDKILDQVQQGSHKHCHAECIFLEWFYPQGIWFSDHIMAMFLP